MTNSPSSRRRWALLSSLALAGGLLVTLAPTAAAAASCDTTAPTIVDLSFTPSSMDVTSQRQQMTVTVQATDDLSGIGAISVAAHPGRPFASSSRSVGTLMHLVSGSRKQGTWTGRLSFPKHTASGRWSLSLWTTDTAANSVDLQASDLGAAGLPAHFTVVSDADGLRPVVNSFRLSANAVDTRGHARSVTIRAVVRDRGGSHVRSVTVSLGRQVRQGQYGIYATLERVGSTRTFRATQVVPHFADRVSHAVWKARLWVSDVVGNTRMLGAAALAQRGWQNSLAVTTAPDDTPPVLQSISVTPTTVNATSKSAPITMTARLTDDRSGVDIGFATLRAPDPEDDVMFFLQQSQGTARDGTFSGTWPLPQCPAPGVWTMNQPDDRPLYLYDRTGNLRVYTGAQLTKLGQVVNVTVK